MLNLNKFYKELEEVKEFDWVQIRNIELQFSELSNQYISKRYKRICDIESSIWGFELTEGNVYPKFSRVEQNGKTTFQHPNCKEFNQFESLYFQKRLNKLDNKYLVFRYNFIFWHCSKNNNYAKKAISALLILFDNSTNYEFRLNYLKSLLNLSSNIRFNFIEIEKRASTFIDTVEKGYLLISLADFLLSQFKVKQTKKLLLKILANCRKEISRMNIDNFGLISFVETGIEICKKAGLSSDDFHRKAVDYYLNQVNDREGFVIHDSYFNAIKHLTEIGDEDMLDSIYVKLESSKNTIKLPSNSFELNHKEIQDFLENIYKRANKISKLDSRKIYEYLCLGNFLLPKEELNRNKKPNFLDTLNTASFDINKNFSNIRRSGINTYLIFLQNFTIREISLLFSKGIISGKITYSNLLIHLYENTWIGKDYTQKDYDGNDVYYNCVELIAPSIFDFFMTYEYQVRHKRFNSSYILSIDSLTLKIELIIRTFAKLIGVPTIKLNKKKDGTRERYIEEILNHHKFQKYFSEDEIFFFLFVMTKSNEGLNLRNNIAHSFFKYEDYSANWMFLLITIILRMGKYDLSSNNSNQSS